MSRAFVFVHWDEPIKHFLRWNESHPEVRAFACQLEYGKKRGHLHIQGFVRVDRPMRYTAINKILGITASKYIKTRGTDAENIAYATKRDGFEHKDYEPLIFGTFAKQGERKDLIQVFREGESGTLIFDESVITVASRYPRYFDRCMALFKGPSIRQLEITYLWGPTGSGKTFSAYKENPDLYALFSYSPEWWDGYDTQDVVLFDDFRGCIPCHRMLRILDPYPLQVPIKGSSRFLRATKIIITSNLHPEEIYRSVDEPTHAAWLRRIQNICYLGGREGGSSEPAHPLAG